MAEDVVSCWGGGMRNSVRMRAIPGPKLPHLSPHPFPCPTFAQLLFLLSPRTHHWPAAS